MKPDINVTPLIDVLLVLLIIFMVISPLKPAQFEAKIPDAPDRSENIKANSEALVVEINSDAELELNNQKTGTIDDATDLSETLAKVFRERLDNRLFDQNKTNLDIPASEKVQKTVFIKAPKAITYGQVAKVIDAVKIAGANPVSLQIDDLK